MLSEAVKQELILCEEDIHHFLKGKGFETNYNKKLNANGCDVVAIKNGEVFLIEHKKISLNDTTGAYKINGDINGDVLLVTTPTGKTLIMAHDKISFTKTIRFIESLDL